MATLELILLLLAAVLVSAVIAQFVPKIAAPLIQIVLGIGVELFTADTVTINFSADLFLVLFIAPLLYDEARRADKAALMRNIRPVLGLAIGLVLITMFSIGGAVHWLVPAIPFTAALALGAALGPTDAVAVSSLPKDIEIGERRKQILQGEYLLNDASGIVGFQFALAATITGAFSVTDASVKFLVVFFGGLAVGAIVGFAANAIERYIRNIGLENTTFHVLFDIFLPFIIYLVAEPFGASGIIAVVVGGLVRSLANKGGVEPVTSRLNIVSDSVWQTISFALNGVVFVLLGTQLPRAMQYTVTNPLVGKADLLLWVVVITLILLATRFVWLAGEEWNHHRNEGWRFFSRENLMSALIMTIAGPKGAVTLSIIFTIPVLASESAFFPERSLIIFLASGVILLTLLLSNFVLPLFAPKRDLAEEERLVRERDTQASVEVLRSVVRGLLARQTEE
ncbi:MAG: sodium:proton antiporter, partial [Eggerthellaceae bacterium]|nr:sodium:proton antiporter [Eggerthellaceae bacterium]